MAKYTCITKPQVMALRNLLVVASTSSSVPTTTAKNYQKNVKNSKDMNTATITKNGSRRTGGKNSSGSTPEDGPFMIQRHQLHQAMQQVNLISDPDQEVLDLLFTMWCSTDQGKQQKYLQVPWLEFMISISLLACKTDSLDQALRFSLYVISRNRTVHASRTVSSTDAIAFIHGKYKVLCHLFLRFSSRYIVMWLPSSHFCCLKHSNICVYPFLLGRILQQTSTYMLTCSRLDAFINEIFFYVHKVSARRHHFSVILMCCNRNKFIKLWTPSMIPRPWLPTKQTTSRQKFPVMNLSNNLYNYLLCKKSLSLLHPRNGTFYRPTVERHPF
jgi:hypothetical protein